MVTTIKDIARETGVSYATVSRGLTGKPGVKEETRLLILEKAKQMGYEPNGIARGLVLKQTNTLALIIPDITNPFYPEIARGVEDAASQLGYNIFLCNTNYEIEKEKEYLRVLKERRVDGLILCSEQHNEIQLDIPTVLLNRISSNNNYSCIEVDNIKGGYIATKHLLEAGYKKIAFIGGTISSFSNINRTEGYKKALNEFKVEIDESMILNGGFRRENGYELMQRIMKSGNIPDAVFASNDVLALGVLQCAQEYGLKIPEDFGVVGFDDIAYAKIPQVQLTTIAQPKYEIGKYAIDILVSEMRKASKGEVQKIILEPELIIRKTTRTIYG